MGDCMQTARHTKAREWERLRHLVSEKCLTTDHPYTLSTGQQSDFYFDCKKAMLDGECLSLIAEEFLRAAAELHVEPQAIGGLTMGADFIVAATILRAYQSGRAMTAGSVVRKEPKHHGTKRTIENQLGGGVRIMVVDDVITSGRSTELACDAFRSAGYEIVGIVSLVDRESGGRERLRNKYRCEVKAIFGKRDFPEISASVSDVYRHPPEPIAVSA